ncbi:MULTISPECIES: hypothetical protein [Micromonospora]|uniref:Uncharacterized protein n=1 Tax=Micromonospora rifamycinica TaxID=291594 RepID=A0A1C5GNJ7_9ACTN|nr:MULTISPECIES: hypothetical protein [Micromonospora]WFE66468.1 hypothetical protein O7625_25620 [Micromonospora sp. WMMD714]SCG35380.1 hypothetical protein GA0070623_0085 [Micromonospora rifamycinica]
MENLDHPSVRFVAFVRACYAEYSRFVWAFCGGAPVPGAARPTGRPTPASREKTP